MTELIIYRGDAADCAWLDRYVRENCKDPPAGPRVTLCRSKEQAAETLRVLSASDGEGLRGTFSFRTQTRTYLLRMKDIRYFTGKNHQVFAVLQDGARLKSVTLRVTTAKFLAPLLSGAQLLHTAWTTYVNPACVRAVEARQILLDDGTALNISRNCYQSVVATLERMTNAHPCHSSPD